MFTETTEAFCVGVLLVLLVICPIVWTVARRTEQLSIEARLVDLGIAEYRDNKLTGEQEFHLVDNPER